VEGTAEGVAEGEAEPPAEGTAEGVAEGAAEPPADATQRAAEINRRVAGWAYRIRKYKYDSMSKHLEDLLQEVDKSGT
jgi:hypothetical protein